MNNSNSAKLIAVLNDRLRCQGDKTLGEYKMTVGVSALSKEKLTHLLELIRNFDQFNEDNDPYGEHDLGKVSLDNEEYYFKIDYYNRAKPNFGSEDPADPKKTKRVMTIMRTDEY
jgi:hypothetical protein